MAHFYISHILGNIYKCIWKILLSTFRKWYGSCALELNSFFRVEVTTKKLLSQHKKYCNQQKIQRMSYFWHFNDHNSRNQHNQTNDTNFPVYSLSFIHWYIWFLHFKTMKIQFMASPLLLHYVLVCKMNIYIPPLHCVLVIYMPKITLSSLLT